MISVGLLTCEKLPDLLAADQTLIPELKKHGVNAKPAIWDYAKIDWNEFDFLIFRNTWDYYEKEEHFNQWLDRIENLKIKTLNPISVIRKNIHKFYLKDFQANGIQILPTIFIEKTPNLNLAALIPEDWKKAVIKPAFSAGSYMTECFDITEIQDINKRYQPIAVGNDLLLQQFMPEIQTLGETSFIFFNKKFSHCVNKMPAENDFRVQFQFGGKYRLINPNKALIDQAQKVVNQFEENLLYARVDGIVIDNRLHLMEVECIEPDLYNNLKDGAVEMFVSEIVEAISQKLKS